MAILITGASAGFGKAMCRRFAEAGYHVIGAARRTDKLEALQAELGERFYPLQMDVSDQASVDAALQSLPEPFAEIDALINNAGLALGLEPAGQADFADWLTMINTNIIGLTYLTRQVLPQMVARKSGYIINLGSIAGTYPYPGGNVWCEQGLCAPIQPKFARRFGRHRCAREQYRAGLVRRHGIFQCAL